VIVSNPAPPIQRVRVAPGARPAWSVSSAVPASTVVGIDVSTSTVSLSSRVSMLTPVTLNPQRATFFMTSRHPAPAPRRAGDGAPSVTTTSPASWTTRTKLSSRTAAL
jgi:hypothetical protein